MTFSIDKEAYTGKVVLKVNDLLGMVGFYQSQIGLDVLKSTEESTVLGISKEKRELVELKQVKNPNSREIKTGLFHMAFKVPTRKDLGNILFSLIAIKRLDVEGASDHGYSEAIYLTDPEGNGIEIYRDKPMDEWDIREDGSVEGYTAAMDANGVLDARDKTPTDRMPQGTVMGHVHLMVSDLKEAETFYTNVLGLGLKSRFGNQALFYAAGDYHHHIGLNTWNSRGAAFPEKQDLGLEYYTLVLPNEDEQNRVKENILEKGCRIFEETERSFKVKDSSGITVQLEYYP